MTSCLSRERVLLVNAAVSHSPASLLLGAPVTIRDLKKNRCDSGDARELRADGLRRGIVVGPELRRLRAVAPAIAAVDWSAHDERSDSDEESSVWSLDDES